MTSPKGFELFICMYRKHIQVIHNKMERKIIKIEAFKKYLKHMTYIKLYFLLKFVNTMNKMNQQLWKNNAYSIAEDGQDLQLLINVFDNIYMRNLKVNVSRRKGGNFFEKEKT